MWERERKDALAHIENDFYPGNHQLQPGRKAPVFSCVIRRYFSRRYDSLYSR